MNKQHTYSVDYYSVFKKLSVELQWRKAVIQRSFLEIILKRNIALRQPRQNICKYTFTGKLAPHSDEILK